MFRPLVTEGSLLYNGAMSFGIKIRPSDKLFSQYIRIRDRKCMRCSSPVEFNSLGLPITHQASHFQGRRKEATRFDPENVDCLCFTCHAYLGENPYEHVQFQVKLKGQRAVDLIVLRSNGYKKRDDKGECFIWKLAIEALTKEQRSAII